MPHSQHCYHIRADTVASLTVQERGKLTERACSGVSTQTPLPSGHHPSSPGTNSAGNHPSFPLFPTFQTSRPPVHAFGHFSTDTSSPMNQLRVQLERENYKSPALGEFGVSTLPAVWQLLQSVYGWWVHPRVSRWAPWPVWGLRGSWISDPAPSGVDNWFWEAFLVISPSPRLGLSCIYLHL